ncbi:DUF4181 domain-containing protein [Gracilibacillus sp. S3-1-1]|uniref:DUF4181 domain-containing protein n=1 Tax=Gracilibacillus pellucidus TaxID=3095368 RepID=A0ACC6M8U9_9BACI|nr:DUF4181 domain-containing protein [Gracilibacillus sp. S3-1-1]MDX8047187.1 DUF4181 domain-containing protein [Gracilibacillus sp. S3-1-1]
MLFMLIIYFSIFALDQIINRKLIKIKQIEDHELEKKFLNKWHEYTEKGLRLLTLLIIPFALSDYTQLRWFVFIIPCVSFILRVIMERKMAPDSSKYLLSVVTLSLLVSGLIVYSIIYFSGVV